MGLTADMRLFARKGEAAPAGVGLSQFPTEVPNAAEETTDDGVDCGSDGGDARRDAAGLSFLIQRRKPVATEPAPSGAAAAAKAGRGPSPSAAGSKTARRSAPAAPAAPVRTPIAAAAAPSGDAPPETWHKLSFRVRNDQYRKLKALSGLWGASYQGILERAVAAFVDSAIGAEDADWDA